SYGGVDSLSPTAARHRRFAGSDESARGATEERSRHHGCDLPTREARAGGRGFFARVRLTSINNKSQDPQTEKGNNIMRSMSTRVFLAGLVLGIAGLGVVAAGTVTARAQPKPAAMEVKIDNFTFGPAELTVTTGTTITWTNRDDIPHTVVSTDKVFKSKVLDTDDQFSFTFGTPGTFPYFCSIHPKMTGTVVVQ